MKSKISLKNRTFMAYNGEIVYLTVDKKYYQYIIKKDVLLSLFSIIDFIVEVFGLGLFFYIFYTLSVNFLLNFIIALIVYFSAKVFTVLFLGLILMFFPIHEITKEEYELELKKAVEDDNLTKITSKKKSFFKRYKEYKDNKLEKS